MTIQLQATAIIACIVLLVFIFELVRKKYLKENYSLIWFLVGGGFLLLSVFGQKLTGLAHILGFELVSNAIIVYTIFLLLILILGLSVAVTRLTNLTQILSQEIGLLKQKLEKENNSTKDGSE